MLYTVVCWIFRQYFRFVCRWEIKGRENLPQSGPFIICANHISWLDPPLVGSVAWPQKINFMAKDELFHIPVFGYLISKVKAFPVKRDSADRRAIKYAIDVIKNGEILGLFPEGTRSRTKELLPPQPGVGLIAHKSKALVLPVAIMGPYKPFVPIRVRIGKPLNFSEYYEEKARAELLERIAVGIMSEIDSLRGAPQ
ncbi:MAG: 1-acyl-sn-glycerol-3-phosphate acyltransferase [Dethiobacter sp.]|nr:1-acyl-sn-glycerol-3-phosphate acyltransferase [Dethiobacter sp.]